jgi:hypothetical protein
LRGCDLRDRGLHYGTIILRLESSYLGLIVENQEIEWAQLKARIPRKLHREAKIASVILDRPIVDICIEALENAVKEADKTLTKTFRKLDAESKEAIAKDEVAALATPH